MKYYIYSMYIRIPYCIGIFCYHSQSRTRIRSLNDKMILFICGFVKYKLRLHLKTPVKKKKVLFWISYLRSYTVYDKDAWRCVLYIVIFIQIFLLKNLVTGEKSALQCGTETISFNWELMSKQFFSVSHTKINCATFWYRIFFFNGKLNYVSEVKLNWVL